MAKWLDSQAGLINWKASMAMIGMAKSKPIQARVAAIAARDCSDTYRENKEPLKRLVESATQVAQAQGRADLGTAVHEFTELIDSGTLDWDFVPTALRGPLEAYQQRMQEFTMLDSEVFVAVDELVHEWTVRSAGSLDRVVYHPDLGVVVADIKTGSEEPKYPLAVSTQVAIYSRGKRYRDTRFPGSPEFEGGEPNSDSTAWRKPLHEELNTEVGLLIHLPLDRVECGIYVLDLNFGWEALKLGKRVQEMRKPPRLVRIS